MANSGKPSGNKQASSDKPWLKCGEVGTYAQLNKKRAKPKFERDHVPSHAAMLKAAKSRRRGLKGKQLSCVKNRLKDQALTIAIPKGIHRKISRTCGSRNDPKQITKDSGNLNKATNDDLTRIQNHLDAKDHGCKEHYRQAAEQVKAQDHDQLIDDIIEKCTS